MVYELMDRHCADDGEPSPAPEGDQASRSSPLSRMSNLLCCEMSVPVLVAHCLKELSNYRRGEPCTDVYGVELLRCATVKGDQEAWTGVQHCLSEVVRGWLRRHPSREAACRLENEENYVAQAFERFWQATTLTQQVEFSTLAAALQYLRACLNGTMLDTLRTYSRPREASLPERGESEAPQVEHMTSSSEVWDILQTILSNTREQRLAYLLFHCGLGPREIVRFCPQEWSDVQEIYHLRRSILERLLLNASSIEDIVIPTRSVAAFTSTSADTD
jgi:DNA-directed RNA polymerase specialized sigma24 family protein